MSAHRRTSAAACAAALGVVLVLVLGTTGSGQAAEDRGCPGVTDREQARAVLDPGRDGGSDGVACESRPRRGAGGGGDTGGPATTPQAVPADSRVGHCSAFGTQADAQAALQRNARGLLAADDAGDLLDTDDDGVACEQHFGTEGRQVAVHPEGGVSAGGARRP